MKNENVNNKKINILDNVLCKVYLFLVETDRRMIQIASKNTQLTEIEKKAIENEYGKIMGIYDPVGSKDAVFLSFT
ncbi:MAG: hypothetical protein WC466_05370 [Candidatus Izemoplasmatales bacterium]